MNMMIFMKNTMKESINLEINNEKSDFIRSFLILFSNFHIYLPIYIYGGKKIMIKID